MVTGVMVTLYVLPPPAWTATTVGFLHGQRGMEGGKAAQQLPYAASLPNCAANRSVALPARPASPRTHGKRGRV